ncbi:hypothetical protein E1B28_011898 [Marasmius oreades]|uniref:Uncharacterized protein n=1 Tax=Marasmius oreades TaxID=181124 RepID=A0A9P7RV90_9AGAR|nr:uncharacterized protein E1B28_011898 [Marasmius oreades]KAG7090300.1 hypothetical protein E1B28_011898 [Marasmius oreades]
MVKHVLLYTAPAWGHTKPLVSLMILIAESHSDIVFTFITNVMYPKIMAELGKLPKERYEKVRGQIHVIHIHNPTMGPFADPGFIDAIRRLYRCEYLTCATSGRTTTGLPKPCLAIIDPFVTFAINAICQIRASPKELPIFCWVSSPVGAMIRAFGPQYLGGREDITAEVDKLVYETGRDRAEVVIKVFSNVKGEVVTMPGYPPMFDYEWFQQEVDLGMTTHFLRAGRESIHKAEGTLFVTASVIEREAIEAMKEYFRGMEKRLVPVGLVSSMMMPDVQVPSDTDDEGVVAFLDKIYKEQGEKSLFYVSFGSVWWPKDATKIYAVIDELIQRRTPFILGHGSPRANVPEEVKSKIAVSGIGLEDKWAPQETILRHPATGWFITHGGWNSVQEGMQYKVPLIFWPMSGDQPMNASLMTLKYRAGFQLISVRTGKHTKRPYRCDYEPSFSVEAVRKEFRLMVEKCRGEEGRMVRANFEQLREAVLHLWDIEGGEARVEIEEFLKAVRIVES